MTISTRDELKTEIGAWSHRSDLSAKLDDFIMLAERGFLRRLQLRVNEAVTSGTTSGATIALPTGLARIERIQIESGGSSYTLDYTSPNGIEGLTASTGQPTRFVVENQAIRLIPAPSGSYTYSVYYIPNFTPLSASNTSNWILANAPDVYLYASLEQLALYSHDDENAKKWAALRQVAVDAVSSDDHARRLPIAGGLQIKPRSAR